MPNESNPRPVILCVLDGWGLREETADNAIAQARTPVWDEMMAGCPHAALDASAEEVGLPHGQMGNSEVGHMNLGAGRVVLQDLPRIDAAVADGSLAAQPALEAFVARLKATGGAAHLLGLMSPGGVHSHQDHIVALARILAAAGVPVRVHAFLDGRDTPPRSAPGYMATFLEAIAGLDGVSVATVSGRYYAMDRDKRWDRVARAHAAIVDADGVAAADAAAAIANSHRQDVTDEFVLPAVVAGYDGMHDGDGVLMANFRADRAREILSALLDPAFDGFARQRCPRIGAACGMVEYSADLARLMDAIFPPEQPTGTLGEIVSARGLRQLRIAETEKYAHVTFFLNGGREEPFDGEERILVPSPRVATYDLQPEMSAPEVTDRLVEAVASGRFDLVVVNYANTDMVGHTGDLKAAIAAVEAVDTALGRLRDAVRAAGGALLVTADHGNAEAMRDAANDEPHTAHTHNRVPVVLVNGPDGIRALSDGRLADIAPTILDLMGIAPSREMSGHSLLVRPGSAAAATAAA